MTREFPFPGRPDETVVQELREDGNWWFTELKTNSLPMTPASGSHNTHSRLSPSSAKQWLNCTASIGYVKSLESRLPADNSTDYSREGTLAHDYAADVLLGKTTVLELPEDFRPHIETYVSHCHEVTPEGALVLVEQRVPLFYMPEENGTTDFMAITEDRVVVRDLKYGAGVLVYAEDNEQLAIYALSAIRSLQDDGLFLFHPATQVSIAPVQPRHREAQGVEPWELTLADLEAFCEPIQKTADLIRSNEGLQFVPGEDTCRWCRAKAVCTSRARALSEAFEAPHIEGIDLLSLLPDLTKDEKKLSVEERISTALGAADPDVLDALDDETLVKMYAATKGIASFLDDVAEYLKTKADQGQPVEGTKLVMGREGNRAWSDEETADAWLKNQGLKQEDRYDQKLKSPTKIEEALKEKLATVTRTRKRFDELVSRSAAKPVLALASDKRPAVESLVALLPDVEGENASANAPR